MKKVKPLALVVFGMLVIWNCAHAQDGLSRRNSIQIGYLRSWTVPAGFGTVGYERRLGAKMLLLLTLGVNPITSKWEKPLYYRLFLYADAEARYYFAKWDRKPLSGFYAGLGLSRENIRYYYHGTNNLRHKGFWNSVGLTLGYQFAFGDRFRLNLGTMLGYPDHTTGIRYDQQGRIVFRNESPIDYTLTIFLKFGITL